MPQLNDEFVVAPCDVLDAVALTRITGGGDDGGGGDAAEAERLEQLRDKRTKMFETVGEIIDKYKQTKPGTIGSVPR